MFGILKRIKNYFFPPNPLFQAVDQYLERSHREAAAALNRPRRRTRLEKEFDQYLFEEN